MVQLTGNDGIITKHYLYSVFGIELNQDPNDTNPWRYSGGYWDKGSNTYYLKARYYDPVKSRMFSEDSIRGISRKLSNGKSIIDPLSLNLYTYCGNNPLKYIDPSGHYSYETSVILLDSSKFSQQQLK